jgi:chromosomal replication initiator protein
MTNTEQDRWSRAKDKDTEQDRWSRVKGRLRSSVGEDVYSSWLPMDRRAQERPSLGSTVSQGWFRHYAERVLTCWQAEMPVP